MAGRCTESLLAFPKVAGELFMQVWGSERNGKWEGGLQDGDSVKGSEQKAGSVEPVMANTFLEDAEHVFTAITLPVSTSEFFSPPSPLVPESFLRQYHLQIEWSFPFVITNQRKAVVIIKPVRGGRGGTTFCSVLFPFDPGFQTLVFLSVFYWQASQVLECFVLCTIYSHLPSGPPALTISSCALAKLDSSRG